MSAAKELKDLYEKDGHDWYFRNAQLLKQGKINEIDIENIAEELESMGKAERNKLESFLIQLFLHLLKWKYQPKLQCSSWESSIKKQRIHAKDHIKENPSLKGSLTEIVNKAYRYARLEAESETGLPIETFPEEMPFTLEESLKDKWFPA